MANTLLLKDTLTGQIVKSDNVYGGFFTPGTDKNRSYEDAQYEIETSPTTLIFTLRADNWTGPNAPQPERFVVSRAILTGKFTSDKNGNFSGKVDRITSFGLQSNKDSGLFMETAQSYNVNKGAKVSSTLVISPKKISSASYFYSNYSDVGFDLGGRFAGTPVYTSRSELKGLPDISFFKKDWWQAPFDSNLI